MKTRALVALVMMILALAVCGCLEEEDGDTADRHGGKINEQEINSASPTTAANKTTHEGKKNSPADSDSIEKKLQSMTLEEKIGQMVMIGVYGTELNDDITFSMNNFHFGGVIFFDRNLESVAQARKFANDIETVANQKAPLFFALDEEGGTIARGESFLRAAPSQEEIGLTGDPKGAQDCAVHNATILRSIGVN